VGEAVAVHAGAVRGAGAAGAHIQVPRRWRACAAGSRRPHPPGPRLTGHPLLRPSHTYGTTLDSSSSSSSRIAFGVLVWLVPYPELFCLSRSGVLFHRLLSSSGHVLVPDARFKNRVRVLYLDRDLFLERFLVF
jgi:hypothetical protein